jgi:hypothetical protein
MVVGEMIVEADGPLADGEVATVALVGTVVGDVSDTHAATTSPSASQALDLIIRYHLLPADER